MSNSNPAFVDALTFSDLQEGTAFAVWDMAKGEFIAAGLIVLRRFEDSDVHPLDLRYVDADGKQHKFDPAEFGVCPEHASQAWAHRITVPADYLERPDELPRIPRVAG